MDDNDHFYFWTHSPLNLVSYLDICTCPTVSHSSSEQQAVVYIKRTLCFLLLTYTARTQGMKSVPHSHNTPYFHHTDITCHSLFLERQRFCSRPHNLAQWLQTLPRKMSWQVILAIIHVIRFIHFFKVL